MNRSPAPTQSDTPRVSRFEKSVERIRWYVLLGFVSLFSMWFGSDLQKKIDRGDELTPLEKFGEQLQGIPQNTRAIIKDSDVLRDVHVEPEQLVPEGVVYVVGEDTIPIDKNYLYSQYHPDGETLSVTLRNLSTNQILHRWQWDYDTLMTIYDRWLDERRPYYRHDDFYWDTLPRFGLIAPTLLDNNRLVAQVGGVLCCFDADGKIEWSLKELKHHSVEVDHEGQLWLCSVVPDTTGSYREDLLLRVDSATGAILFERTMKEIFEGNPDHDYSHHNRDNVDPYHLNDIQPVMFDSEHWRKGDLFISLRNISRVLLYRPTTDEILWSNATYWSMQHDVDIVNADTITVFDNNLMKDRPKGKERFKYGNFNRCMTFNFKTREFKPRFSEIFEKNECRTITQGRLKWFEEDDVLYIESGDQDFFFVADLKTNRSYRCILRGNSSGKAGRNFWFRLVD